jgi:hypothetical protein
VAAALTLVCVFAALTVSVVNARRPLDARVSESFDSTVSRIASATATITPLGCRQHMLDFYDCSAVVRPRRQAGSVTLRYSLSLTDDGCWSAARGPQAALSAGLGRLAPRLVTVRGCVADASH